MFGMSPASVIVSVVGLSTCLVPACGGSSSTMPSCRAQQTAPAIAVRPATPASNAQLDPSAARESVAPSAAVPVSSAADAPAAAKNSEPASAPPTSSPRNYPSWLRIKGTRRQLRHLESFEHVVIHDHGHGREGGDLYSLVANSYDPDDVAKLRKLGLEVIVVKTPEQVAEHFRDLAARQFGAAGVSGN